MHRSRIIAAVRRAPLTSLLAALLLAMAARPADAQQVIPGAVGLDDETGQAHTWIALDLRENAAALFHIPPDARREGEIVADLASRLMVHPEAIAAHGRDAYLVFPARRESDGVSRRSVLAISTVPVAGSGQWRYTGSPRLRALPSLPGERELLGIGASEGGLHALVRGGDGVELLRLDGKAWVDMDVPDGALSPGEQVRLRLVDAGDGLILLRGEPGAAPRVWRRHAGEDAGWTRAAPEFEAASRGAAGALSVVADASTLAWFESASDDRIQVMSATPYGRFTVGPARDPGEEAALLPGGDGAGVLLITRTPGEQGLGELTLQRLSLADGATLESGPIVAAGPVSSSQFLLVIVLLAGVMMLILTFVFWPEDLPAPALPRELEMAPSAARLVAGLIDLIVGVIPASLIVGVPISDVLLPGLAEDPTRALVGTVLGVAIAATATTIGEWLFRRSLGKGLLGLEVLRLDESGLRRITLWEAIVRNAIRWGVAPVALAGLSTASGRHLGDLAARTVVVRRAAEDEPPEG